MISPFAEVKKCAKIAHLHGRKHSKFAGFDAQWAYEQIRRTYPPLCTTDYQRIDYWNKALRGDDRREGAGSILARSKPAFDAESFVGPVYEAPALLCSESLGLVSREGGFVEDLEAAEAGIVVGGDVNLRFVSLYVSHFSWNGLWCTGHPSASSISASFTLPLLLSRT